MAQQVAAVRHAFPSEIELHFAMKANPMFEVVRHMSGLVDGLDVASGRELEIALTTDISRSDISFAGPGKSVEEIRRAIEAQIVLNIESPRELREVVAYARSSGARPKVAIRVNPDFELKSSGMKMGGGPRQFGIDAEAVPGILREIAGLPVEFMGFHIFSGSQNLRAHAIVESQEKAVALAVRLAAHSVVPVRLLNIGGGLGIPYFPGERRLDLAPIGAGLSALQLKVQQLLPHCQLVVELGRYFVGDAGLYVCRVIDRKISRGQTFLVTDGGLHHHLAASGNFGQIIRKNYPVIIGNKVQGREREVCSVVGPLCTPLDLLADQMEMARGEEGDLVAVFMSGAYGYTASPLNFLSHPEPLQFFL